MSNLVKHAEHELSLLGLDDPDNDFYGGMTRAPRSSTWFVCSPSRGTVA